MLGGGGPLSSGGGNGVIGVSITGSGRASRLTGAAFVWRPSFGRIRLCGSGWSGVGGLSSSDHAVALGGGCCWRHCCEKLRWRCHGASAGSALLSMSGEVFSPLIPYASAALLAASSASLVRDTRWRYSLTLCWASRQSLHSLFCCPPPPLRRLRFGLLLTVSSAGPFSFSTSMAIATGSAPILLLAPALHAPPATLPPSRSLPRCPVLTGGVVGILGCSRRGSGPERCCGKVLQPSSLWLWADLSQPLGRSALSPLPALLDSNLAGSPKMSCPPCSPPAIGRTNRSIKGWSSPTYEVPHKWLGPR